MRLLGGSWERLMKRMSPLGTCTELRERDPTAETGVLSM